ncbi:hypothetical protein B0A49_05121 [Cryomyces minteri]|uniref:THO complex subunit 2 n=3 Tax=Cryomyces TaxID=329878 RepID=A0A4U0XMJ6_9PEZI|nr:hypothetical protein B0A49_05121 [Cryomyces minteri]
MAPNYGKRKRGDRNYSQDSHDGSNRPSPHWPGNLNLAQQNQHHSQMQNGRGGRRRSRGGQGGNQSGSPSTGLNSQPSSTRTSPTISHAMSPPSLQTRGLPENKPPVQKRPPNPNDAPAPNPATPPKAPASEYYYQYITEELVQSWRRDQNQVIMEQAVEACREDDAMALSTMFQELLRSGLDGRISPEDAGSAIKDILSNEASIGSLDLPSVFVDSISTTLDQADRQSPKAMALIASSGVPPAVLLGELDGTELIDLGLVRGTFIRMQTRKTTGLLYRQANYNLLREETEGYSKLLTEYFTTSNSSPPTGEVVEETFLRVKALIGAFDLDVGRVIDITLDVFANLLVKHRHFFIKFLRTSSWWPTAESFDNIKWRDQGFGSLPSWASPESSQWDRWEITEEEKERLSALRQLRDAEFWDRVREVGMAAFFELDGRRITNYDAVVDQLDQKVIPEIDKAGNESYREKTVRKAEDLKWMKETRTLPPSGNPDAAQLLGFKLRFYASPARDASDTLPDNLIYLAALLIKVGFISLRDLYPHLYPHDDKMAEVQEKLMKEKAEREKLNRPGGGARNALAMAGALADDTLPSMGRPRDFTSNRGAAVKSDGATDKSGATPAKVDEEKKDELPEPTDQKISLLKSLLCIGAIPESLYMLGKFPWLPDVLPDLPEYIHRIAHHMLSKVYEPARPLRDRSSVQAAKKQVADQAGQPKGILRLADPPSRKTLRWAQLDRGDMGDGVAYRFYWDDWTDNVPICQTVNDVFQLCGTFLNYSGVKIGQDPTLLMKLTRIGKKSLSDDPSKENYARWIDLSKRLLVPALSLTKNNPGVVNEMFDLLKCFPIATRYSIYAEWYTGQISRLPDIKAAFDQARAETKDVLKRISKDNTKSMARALAKVAYASPGIVFSVAINQMEAYDNLIEVVVECARYFTYLGYDVLTWSLMSALGGRGRDRVQADGMLTSSWLKALSLFAGRVFKRYSVMSPSPILQYVTNELRLGNSTDLEVLEQIVSTMAGIPSDMTFNEAQTMAMAGGEALQAQTLLQLGDRRHQSKLSARRLMRSLTEPGLAGQLLISIAQERQTYIHHESSNAAPLKVLGNNLDKIHQVFAQYLDMLRSNLSAEEFDAAIPGVVSLISEFGIEPSIAFTISRPSIAQAIAVVDSAAESEKQSRRLSTEKAQVNGNVEVADDSTKASTDEGDKAASQNGTLTKQESSLKNEEETSSEMKDIPQVADVTSTSTPGPVVNDVPDPWHPVLKPLMQSLRPILREDFESTLSLPFYTTFWTLALHDMVVFSNTYETEIKKHVTALGKTNSDRTDLTTLGMKKKEHEKKSINEVLDRLRGEMRTQIQAYQQVRTRINKEKDHWFTGFVGKSEALCNAIIQDCFYPRILLSPLDAFYTFQMLRFLHSSGAPGFGTMRVMDRILSKQLTALMFQCTSREADNFGRFLNELLKELSTWHADRAVYEKIAYGPKRNLPGFAKKLSAGKVVEFLDFEEFRRLMFKWHGNLNNAFKACFSGGEYMHIRNAIIVLKAVHQSFPVVNFMGKSIFESVTELSESEKREDLKLAATSLLGDLKRREKAWVLPQAFRQGDTASTAQKPVSRSTSIRPETPQRDSGTTKTLNAAAAEFKPKPSNLTNGSANNAAIGKGDAEDGEIEDTKMADAEAKADVEVQLTAPNKSAESEKPASDQVDEAEDKLSAPAVIQSAPPHTPHRDRRPKAFLLDQISTGRHHLNLQPTAFRTCCQVVQIHILHHAVCQTDPETDLETVIWIIPIQDKMAVDRVRKISAGLKDLVI